MVILLLPLLYAVCWEKRSGRYVLILKRKKKTQYVNGDYYYYYEDGMY